MPASGWISNVVADSPIESVWGNSIRDRTITPFLNAAQRDAQIATPIEGMACYLLDVDVLQLYRNGAWSNVAPSPLLAYVEVTANTTGIATTITDIAGLATPALTIPAGRRIEVTAEAMFNKAAPDVSQWVQLQIADVANAVVVSRFSHCIAPGILSMHSERVIAPAAGTYTYKVRANTAAGFVNVQADAGGPAWIRVRDLGPV